MARAHGKKDFLYKSQRARWFASQKDEVALNTQRSQELDKAAAACIVKDGRSFGDFGKEGMVKFLKVAVPGYKAPCRQTIVKMLKLEYLAHRERLKLVLKQLPKIALTTDLWTSRGQINYLCLTAHFFDKDFKYYSIIIGFRKFLGRHLSIKLETFIKKELRSLEVPLSNIQSITSDNGADIKKACSSLSTRVSCMAHNLNLVVKNGLKLWSKPK